MLNGNTPAHPSCQNPNCLLQKPGPFFLDCFAPVSWSVMTFSSSSRETAVFKGHGDSTTHMNQCKICTPDPFPQGMLLPHHTPTLCTNETHPWHEQSARDGLPAAGTKEGSREDQQNGVVATLAC